MFAKGRDNYNEKYSILNKVTELDILSLYFNVEKIPCIINSPLREDKHPSFGFFIRDEKLFYHDFATKESGDVFTLLSKLWGIPLRETINKIYEDINIKPINNRINVINKKYNISNICRHGTIDLKCKRRDFKDYDIKYWEEYNISLEWLKYAEIYPISHTIINKDDKRYVLPADMYAYSFIEHKDDIETYKIYQPFNTKGHKWMSNMNSSIWSLWTKIPLNGDNLIISSSLKDCLNIWATLKIPSICMQGEGYEPKSHVIQELKQRYKNIIIFFDNDFTKKVNTGRDNSIKLSRKYDFQRIEIPEQYGCKDPSDLFKKYKKEDYIIIMQQILKNKLI